MRPLPLSITFALLLGTGGCTLDAIQRTEGPADILLAPYTHLKLARSLVFLPPAEGAAPGVLGVVLTRDETAPRMMLLVAKSRDARGRPEVELVGWDEAPARQRPGSGTDFH